MDRLTRRRIVVGSVAALVAIGLLDLAGLATGGFPSKVVDGVSVTAGAPAATEWWLAAGSSQGGAVMDIHLFVPGDDPARVVLRYFPGEGNVAERRVDVPARSARTIVTSADRAGGFGGGYPGISVEVRSDVPIVVERTLAWNAPDAGRDGFTTGPAVHRLVTEARFITGGKVSVHVFNPGPVAATVTVGDTTLEVPPRDRREVHAGGDVSVSSSLPVAVERVLQRDGGVDVSSAAMAGVSGFVPRPFDTPITITRAGPCTPRSEASSTAPAGVVVLGALPCPAVSEWSTAMAGRYRDVVAQPAADAAARLHFAQWGTRGEEAIILIYNPQPDPQEVVITTFPRQTVGGDLPPPPSPPQAIVVAGRSPAFVALAATPAAIAVEAARPVAAWRVTSAEREFVQHYTDPGFG